MAAGIGVRTRDQLALLHADIDQLAANTDWQLSDDQLLQHLDHSASSPDG